MNRTVLSAAIALALAGGVAAQEIATAPEAERSGGVVPITYTGDRGRIGLGIDQDGDLLGELLGIFAYDGTRAFLGEGWLGHGGAGGIKFAYNWLWGGRTREDTINDPDSILVSKFFVAADRNAYDDRKASIGFGLEKRDISFDLYYSRALSDERLVSWRTDSFTETVTGNENGRPWRQEITTETLTELFEHPYEDGIGFRVGRFFEEPLLRVRGGLDYERGDALLDDDTASQISASIGLEKYFSGSSHSLALNLSYHRKDGPFDRPAYGGERDDTRASLVWRYDFGRPYRPVQPYQEVEVTREVIEPVPQSGPQVIRNEVSLSGEALFAFDSAVLTGAAKAELAPLVERLREHSVREVEITGHTCDIGTEAYNQGLSERRAASVRDWLVAQGVDPSRLRVAGRGELEPRFPNDSRENRARNRRVEVAFVTIEESTLPPPPPATRTITEWKREPVPTPAAWIERALRNPPAHKREVDTYRIQRETVTRHEGPREFLNQAPVAMDDSAVTSINTPVKVSVLANDSDPDGDSLSITATSQPANGSVAIEGEEIVYTPAEGFTGSDSFTYTVSDPEGLTATATVTITVNMPDNLPPVANPDSVQTPVDTPVSLNVLANDSDPEDDAITLTAIGQPAHGSATFSADGQVHYTPAPRFTGTDTFTYTVTDSAGNAATGTVTVEVLPGPVNRAPVAVDDSWRVFKLHYAHIDVLANDYDPDGDPLVVTQVFNTTGRADISINDDGTILYVPVPGYVGPDHFEYEISDGRGGTARATVEVTIHLPW